MGIYKPELKIEKTATGLIKVEKPDETIDITTTDKPMVRPGDIIIYTIKVSNEGNYKATNVVIKETLDVSFDGKEVKAGEPLVTLETLDFGKMATLKVAYEVTQADVEVPNNIKNIAYATDGKTTEEDEDTSVQVNPDITLSGTKTWIDPAGTSHNTITLQVVYKDGEPYTIKNDAGADVPYTVEENCNGAKQDFLLFS